MPSGHWSSPLKVEFSIENTASGDTLICSDAKKCTVQYKTRATALLEETIPNNVYKGQTVQFYLNPRDTHAKHTPKNADAFYEVKIGEAHANWTVR